MQQLKNNQPIAKKDEKEIILFFALIIPISIIGWIVSNINGSHPMIGIIVFVVVNIVNFIFYSFCCASDCKFFIITSLFSSVLVIISTTLFLIIVPDDFYDRFGYEKASQLSSIHIALMIISAVIFGLVLISALFYTNIKREKNIEKRNNIVNNFYKNNKEKLDELCKQYYPATQRLIESLEDDIRGIFKAQAFWGRLTHKIFAKDLLSTIYVQKDGYEEPLYTEKNETSQNEKKIVNFVNALKEKISSEWDNTETLNLAVYFIIRYNFIKYKSDYYKLNYGFDNLADLCKYSFDTQENLDGIVRLFTYYWILQNDINQPITFTYEKMSSNSKNIYLHIEQEKDKETYFSSTIENSPQLNNNDLSLIEKIDQMDGRSFEMFIANLFESRGYKTTLTKTSGDYGIDVIIENDFLKIGIQTKCYTQKVGNFAIQEAFTGLKHYKLDKAMVITNNYFTSAAIQLAKENNVILWDRNKLIQELNN